MDKNRRGPGDSPLVTVLATNEAAKVAVAQSLLEAAGIRCFTRGEGLQSLFGIGRIGTVNPFAGPVEIQVARSDYDSAREVLRDLLAPQDRGWEEDEDA